ncbi:hypothetical protein JG687_00016891 [Phytophthora cactorum]|uniref:Uncharacterized protein n=1 Tax=Phytophthora cactorum TaxID=29920 RepID=A0A8T1TSX1_9STRA|nr:hypothetical protein JG687_00016891 [Phytophthora cactorum]
MNAQPGRILYPHIMTCSTAPVLTKAKWAVDTSLFTGDNLRDTVADAVELARRFGLPPDVSPASFRLELLDFIERKTSWSVEQREKAAADPPLHWWLLCNGVTRKWLHIATWLHGGFSNVGVRHTNGYTLQTGGLCAFRLPIGR